MDAITMDRVIALLVCLVLFIGGCWFDHIDRKQREARRRQRQGLPPDLKDYRARRKP